MPTIYLSRGAQDQLAHAQAVTDWHIVSCDLCGTNRRCAGRDSAEAVFARFERLPQRTPGLTQSPAPSSFAWLNG